ncbi:hypothetical protein BJV82DRAFT_620156 [Fennellomyces sp. T-0311]|nr:hypothetical protein BJV82DRAFT_620156 [Fennellomyces sp. T-0311]
MIEIYEIHESNILSDGPSVTATEDDYLAKVWSPILDALFNIDGIIRTKLGDSVNMYSSLRKQDMYKEHAAGRAITGFKIDFRTLWDHGQEYNVGAGELTNIRISCRSKITMGEKKILREAKDTLDEMIELDPKRASNVSM